jgi:hypothetical protein
MFAVKVIMNRNISGRRRGNYWWRLQRKSFWNFREE